MRGGETVNSVHVGAADLIRDHQAERPNRRHLRPPQRFCPDKQESMRKLGARNVRKKLVICAVPFQDRVQKVVLDGKAEQRNILHHR